MMGVIKSKILPMPQTYSACDLSTREIVHIPSGEMIHVIRIEDSLLVSEEVYQVLFDKAKINSKFVTP